MPFTDLPQPHEYPQRSLHHLWVIIVSEVFQPSLTLDANVSLMIYFEHQELVSDSITSYGVLGSSPEYFQAMVFLPQEELTKLQNQMGKHQS